MWRCLKVIEYMEMNSFQLEFRNKNAESETQF